MNELTVINQNGQLLMDSRQVAEMVEKEHSHLTRDIRGYLEILDPNPNLDSASFFIESTYIDKQNQQRPCYLLTRKGCEMVANKMTGEKGVLFTAAYVTRFEEMEKTLQSGVQAPKTLKEALILALEQQEKIEQLEHKVAMDKPKILFADSVTASSTSILVGDLAKLIKQNGIDIGEIRLWQWLRNNGYAIKEKGHSYNMPTQKSMDLNVMEVKEGTRINSLGESKITKTTLITGKGQVYFVNKFLASKSA